MGDRKKLYFFIRTVAWFFTFRRLRETRFAGIIKIVTKFIKKIFQDSKKVKRIKSYESKCNRCCLILDIAKFDDFQ